MEQILNYLPSLCFLNNSLTLALGNHFFAASGRVLQLPFASSWHIPKEYSDHFTHICKCNHPFLNGISHYPFTGLQLQNNLKHFIRQETNIKIQCTSKHFLLHFTSFPLSEKEFGASQSHTGMGNLARLSSAPNPETICKNSVMAREYMLVNAS